MILEDVMIFKLQRGGHRDRILFEDDKFVDSPLQERTRHKHGLLRHIGLPVSSKIETVHPDKTLGPPIKAEKRIVRRHSRNRQTKFKESRGSD